MLPPRLKERGGSLPPSALPRPPRSLKPPRKIDYDRLSDADLKARAQTPPKLPPSPTISSSSTVTTASTSSQPNQQQSPSPHNKYDIKSSTLKRNEFGRREFSPSKNYMEMKDSLTFPKPDFSLKRKDYGSMSKTEFSKPDYTSTKNYHRLEESPKPTRTGVINTAATAQDSNSFKRSLLPSARKYSPAPTQSAANSIALPKSSRDSLNSSESNNSSNSNQRSSPMHVKTDSNMSTTNQATSGSYHNSHSRTPPKYIPLSPQEKNLLATRQQNSQRQLQGIQGHKASLPPSSASLPPKPVDTKNARRGASLTRGENRYRIQF